MAHEAAVPESAFRHTVPTTCPLDCPDACSLSVAVAGTQGDERILEVSAGPGNATTGGFICHKVSRFADRVDHRDRLLQPLRRRGVKGTGEFEPIGWDEAVAEVAGRFAEIRERWGGEAILPYHYGGSNGKLTDGLLDDLFFARLGASRLAKTICATPTGLAATALYGKMPGVAYEDYEHARFILLWGANPKASGIHLVPFLKRAKAAGATLAVVDPLGNFSSREIDLHLSIYPGTDLPVALAMIRRWQRQGQLAEDFLELHASGAEALFEAAEEWTLERAAAVARVEAGEIARLADLFADSSPAVLRCGWGLERNRNGVGAVAAVLAMPALLGKFGVRGGGYTMSNSGAARFDGAAILGSPRWQTRILNMTRLGELLAGRQEGKALEPPIQALFVYNANPAVTVPDQNRVLAGLAREDLFTVVSEQVMTDTARFADVVLPATTFLEHWDLRVGYGSLVVGGVRPAMAPRGEARSNHAVFAALGRAMGFDDEAFGWSEEEVFARVAGALELSGRRADVSALAAGGVECHDFPGERPLQMETVQPRTGDGRIHLAPPELGAGLYRFEPLDSPYPLALLSPSSSRLINSTFGESSVDELELTLHPDDARPRGIGSGDAVRVFNELGEVRCRARLSRRARSGVTFMPKGAWRRSSLNGLTSTALCPAETQKVGGGACFNDARVEVERILPV